MGTQPSERFTLEVVSTADIIRQEADIVGIVDAPRQLRSLDPMSNRFEHDVFLSYAHPDREAAERIVGWLRLAGLRVWFDRDSSPAGSILPLTLPETMRRCRSVIRLISENSEGGRIGKQEEYLGFLNSLEGSDRQILPIAIGSTAPQLPSFLASFATIHAPNGILDVDGATALLLALNPRTRDIERESAVDVFVSRPWPGPGRDPSELASADRLCDLLCELGIRAIGDSEDQPQWDPSRVSSIIRSCQALVALVPDRGAGKTSRYIEQEVHIARECGVPYLITFHGSPTFPSDLIEASIHSKAIAVDDLSSPDIANLLDEARGFMPEQHFLFLAIPYRDSDRENWGRVRNLAERVAGISCKIGSEYKDPEEIISTIRKAIAVIADISFESEASALPTNQLLELRGPNSLIEAGIAIGCERPLHLLTSAARRKSPYMFRTRTQLKYGSTVELLAHIHAVA